MYKEVVRTELGHDLIQWWVLELAVYTELHVTKRLDCFISLLTANSVAMSCCHSPCSYHQSAGPVPLQTVNREQVYQFFFLNLGSYWKWIHKQRNEFQTYLKGLPLFTIDSGLRIETNLTVFSFIIYPQYPRQQLIPDIILHYSILRLVWFCDQNNFSHNVTLFPQWNANS